MDIYEIANDTGLSVRTLRKLEKKGLLRTSESENKEAAAILFAMRKGNPLTIFHLAALVENPALLLDLGGYMGAAESQVKALGDVTQEIAPAAVIDTIDLAARGERAACIKLAEWMQETVPTKGEVPHHYLAVRVLLGARADMRPYIGTRIPRAFLNVRSTLPEFRFWFTLRPAAKDRQATFYHAPKNAFDL